jgi:hypothetical protein
MIAVWQSRPGFGQQMAEAVLAVALAVPVIFAFAELRDSRLAGTATAPQQTGNLPDSSETPATDPHSPRPVRVVLSGDAFGQTSVWESRLAVLMEAIALARRDASGNTVEGDAEPETGNASLADESPKAPARGVSLTSKASRSRRPSQDDSARKTQH